MFKRLLFFSLVYGFSYILFASENKAFYVFGEGQGNSHLAIYDGFGVLYDCGSSSQQIHPKLKPLLSQENIRILVKKETKSEHFEDDQVLQEGNAQNEEERQRIREKILQESRMLELEGADFFEPSSSPSSKRTSESSNTYSNVDSTENDIREAIRKAIETHQLKHLFVFVSHPDKDHYNHLIPPSDSSGVAKVLPEDILITVFLCGDWLGRIKEDDNDTGESKDKKLSRRIDFIRQLLKRPNTLVELPYYWNLRHTKDPEIANYHSLKNLLKKEQVTNEQLSVFQPCFYPDNPPCYYQGNLKGLISFLLTINNSAKAMSTGAVSISTAFDYFAEDYRKLVSENKDLENVLIWSMNQRFSSVNSQSTILSCVMPSLNMHFICTGDADDETFYHHLFDDIINTEPLNASSSAVNILYRKEFLGVLNYYANMLNVLIVPHHGSSKNLSRRMLEIFRPSLCIISAGNGKTYGHPNKKTIESYQYAISEGLIENKIFPRFDMEQPGLFVLSYNRKGDSEIGYLFNFSEETLLFSTNVHGTIKFDKDGVYSSFSDLIEIDRSAEGLGIEHYVVNFRKRDQKMSNIMERLRELEKHINQFILQSPAVEEEMNQSKQKIKRKAEELENITEEELSAELATVEMEIDQLCKENCIDQMQQGLHDIEQNSLAVRLGILKNKLRERSVGENIIYIIDKYYYKVVYRNPKKKTETIYYYPVENVDIS